MREFANILAGRAAAFQDVIGNAGDVLQDLNLVLPLVDEAIAR